jgi:thiamine-phosphate pyrophosphorylase
MTDERLGENLFPTLRKLPKGAGVIFRHYSLTRAERAGLFRRVITVRGA